MNIVFFGSSQFAVPSLKALLGSKHKISCVITQPDKQKGRHLHLQSTPVKTLAGAAGIEVYQPVDINAPEAIRFLKNLSPDLFVVIAYGQLLSQVILDIPKIFSINAHASLLPLYRGAAPINWALINGEKVSGISIMKMDKDMDAGPIILQKTAEISGEATAISLEDNLARIAAQALLESLESIENNNYDLMPQDETSVSFAPKIKKEDGKIDWDKPAYSIYNLIRGCLPWPGAFTYYEGKLLKIYKAEVIRAQEHKSTRVPGEIIQVSKEEIIVAAGDDNLIIKELQLEGKRKMNIEEFICGHKVEIGQVLK